MKHQEGKRRTLGVLSERENPQGFPVPCGEGRGHSDPCERNKAGSSGGGAALGPEPLLPPEPGTGERSPCTHQDLPAGLCPAVQVTSKNKNTSATPLLSLEKKKALSKSQLFHLEKNAFHKSDHFLTPFL